MMNTRSLTALRALLLILLLAVQAIGHAHQVDHFVNGDSGPCAICSVGGSLEHATVDTAAARVAAHAFTEPDAPPAFAPNTAETNTPLARAPPVSR